MRADSLPRIACTLGRYGLLLAATLIATGCKTDTGPDDPTILGDPPTEAYLGVEYYYNFGAFGGERILDFSLTNAPSWLALEDTSNKARPGIIMRGVPGLSGGARGDADLGKQENINLLTTDGERAGMQPFDIEVKRNPLSLEAETFTEGEASEAPEEADNRCQAPDLESTGSHSYEINLFDEAGDVIATAPRTGETTPVLVKVLLEQPSVTRVAVAFELTSEFDPEDCDQDFIPDHQRCEEGDANRDEAIIGRDIVALGSNSAGRLPIPDYLRYERDDNNVYSRGVVTLEPGITECYIRLEVVDDTVPEPSESLRLTLTEIRSGLAALGPSDTEVRTTLVIDDNEPVVRLETLGGQQRDAISVGTEREFVAVLTGEREGTIRARLAENEDSVAKAGDYVISTRNEEDLWVEDPTLTFPAGVDRVRFRVSVPDDYTNPGLNDRFLLLAPDQQYQAGRENFAGSADDAELRVNINELLTPLALNDGNAFVPTDLTVGHDGRLFVAGYDSAADDRVLVRIYDQKGSLLQEVAVSDATVVLDQPDPVIAFAQRTVTRDNTRIDRFEFAVSYQAVNDIPGQTSSGGRDAVTTLFWFDSAQPAGSEYVELWTLRAGTGGHDDPRWIGINDSNGAVFVAGETTGRWPRQTRGGGQDSFLQRIDTVTDGDARVPDIAWTRQTGSSADDSVVAGSAATASAYLFGTTTGAIGESGGQGMSDGFFYSASTAEGALDIYQVGTDGDEVVTDGLYTPSNLWLLGNSDRTYTIDEQDEANNILVGEPLNGTNGFILGYSPAGSVNRAFSFGSEDRTGMETFRSLLLFDGDLIAAGSTTGAFVDDAPGGTTQAILGRMDPDGKPEEGDSDDDPDAETETDPDAETDPGEGDGEAEESTDTAVATELWRAQYLVDDAEYRVIANYRDDEIVALFRQTVGGNAQWSVFLFSGEGVKLN